MIDISELRRLEAEATPFPWNLNIEDGRAEVCVDGERLTDPYIGDANAALIVAMRNALPELLKAVEALRQIENTACEGLDFGGTREALIEIKYAARKALPPHGGGDVEA